MARALYDHMGRSYAAARATDPRIAAAIRQALGGAHRVLNVGAGTGSYEPGNREVIALEPSAAMIAQRPPGRPPAIQGCAEDLPLADDSVDAAMALFSDHLWRDRRAGMAEMLRVARERVLVLNMDPALASRFWLTRDYLPAFMELVPERYRDPGFWLDELRELLGAVQLVAIPIPSDCRDGFYQAYWRRPEAYLEKRVRAGISVFERLPGGQVAAAMAQLRTDLDNGTWRRRNEELLELPELDLGLRLAVCHIGG